MLVVLLPLEVLHSVALHKQQALYCCLGRCWTVLPFISKHFYACCVVASGGVAQCCPAYATGFVLLPWKVLNSVALHKRKFLCLLCCCFQRCCTALPCISNRFCVAALEGVQQCSFHKQTLLCLLCCCLWRCCTVLPCISNKRCIAALEGVGQCCPS